MKIFHRNKEMKSYGDRVNFVDKYNTLVGFCFEQLCCEDFEYCFTLEEPKNEKDLKRISLPDSAVEDFFFDTTYFMQLSSSQKGEDYQGGAVCFKLTNEEKDVIYLVFSNHHDGYYSHGFSMKIDGEIKFEGRI